MTKTQTVRGATRSPVMNVSATTRLRRVVSWLYEPGSVLILGLLASIIFDDGYGRLILSIVLVNVLLALSLAMTLETGRLSLAQGALAGVGAFASAWFVLNTPASPALSIFLGCAVAGVAGLLVAALAARLSGFYFVVATLAFAQIFTVLVSGWSAVTGGIGGLTGIPPFNDVNIGPVNVSFGFDPLRTSYVAVLLMVVVVTLVVCRALTHGSRPGRRIRAVGDDEVLARSLGISAAFWRTVAFGVGGVIAGLAGGLQASLTGGVSPSSYSLLVGVLILAMVYTGGRRSLLGAVAGAAILTLAQELSRFGDQTQLILTGLLLVVIALVLPYGLAGLTRRVLTVVGRIGEARA